VPEAGVQVWAAMMLTSNLNVCQSVLRGLPVRAGNLDPEVLRHALRGEELPPANDYVAVSADMLEAVEEAAPFELTRQGRKR
jgi:hypothetical protein